MNLSFCPFILDTPPSSIYTSSQKYANQGRGEQAMKRIEIIFLPLIILALFSCATMDDLKGSISTKVTSITSNVDPALVAKVPGDQRGGFPKAELAVKIGEEKLKLARMKSELAAKQGKYVDYEEELVNIDFSDVSLDYDIVKLQAVDASALGKKEDNIKALTNLKLKKVELQADRIRADANMAAIKRQTNDLAEKIKAQEEKVKTLTADKVMPEKAVAVPIEKDKAAKVEAVQEKPAEKTPAEKSK
jgi:hypothetical protein